MRAPVQSSRTRWVVVGLLCAVVMLGACSGEDDATSSSSTRPSAGSTSVPTGPASSTSSVPELDLEHPFGVHAPTVDSLEDEDMAFPVRRPAAGAPRVEFVRQRGADGLEEYAGIYTLDGATVVVSQALAGAPTTSVGAPMTLPSGIDAQVANAGGVRSVAWSEARGDRFLRFVVYARSGEVAEGALVAFAGSIPPPQAA